MPQDAQVRARPAPLRHAQNHQLLGAARAGASGRFRPSTAQRRCWRRDTRALLLLTAGALVFKALLMLSTGLATYDGRIETLRSGDMAEQAIAWVMQADAVSRALAENLQAVVRKAF